MADIIGGIAQAVNTHGDAGTQYVDTSLQSPNINSSNTGTFEGILGGMTGNPLGMLGKGIDYGIGLFNKKDDSKEKEKENEALKEAVEEQNKKYEEMKKAEMERQAQAAVEEDDSLSDEKAKTAEHFKALDCYRNIDSYLYKYKPQVQQQLGGEKGVDDKPHVGVIAQEVEENIPGVVNVDEESGYKKVDTNHLTLANTAALGEIVRTLDDIKKRLGMEK